MHVARFSLVIFAVLPMSAHAADEVKVRMDAETKKATARALKWLASQQNRDGSWSDARYQHSTAITSFALLAFLSQGHLPGQGLYGPEVAKGCRFLLASARPSDGYLIGSRGGNMYAHGMATLALSQLWGMTGDEKIKPVLQRAVKLIYRCQSPQGGWRYNPVPSDSDVSVTIMQVMALRAAKNSGIHVPDNTLKRAIKYIESCREEESGGYRYQPKMRSTGFARTAAAICSLMLAGEYNSKQIPKAIKYLKSRFFESRYFYYGHYYAAHAMHQIGGKEWAEWYGNIRKTLLGAQSPDGSWTGRKLSRSSVGPVYQTSIAVIVLSVPTHYLPIFQR